jgi:hypothetical protein
MIVGLVPGDFVLSGRTGIFEGHHRACPGDPDNRGTAVPYDRGGRDKPGMTVSGKTNV